MLPPFIIDQIRKREHDDKRHYERPVRELPLPLPARPREHADDDDGNRGVVIIDLGA